MKGNTEWSPKCWDTHSFHPVPEGFVLGLFLLESSVPTPAGCGSCWREPGAPFSFAETFVQPVWRQSFGGVGPVLFIRFCFRIVYIQFRPKFRTCLSQNLGFFSAYTASLPHLLSAAMWCWMAVWDLEDALSLVLPLRELTGSTTHCYHLVHLICSRMLWESFGGFLHWSAQKGHNSVWVYSGLKCLLGRGFQSFARVFPYCCCRGSSRAWGRTAHWIVVLARFLSA